MYVLLSGAFEQAYKIVTSVIVGRVQLNTCYLSMVVALNEGLVVGCFEVVSIKECGIDVAISRTQFRPSVIGRKGSE